MSGDEGVCAACAAMRCTEHQSVQYSHRIDAVIYGADVTRDFSKSDWFELAMAALDQAGLSAKVADELRCSLMDDLSL